ncbi:MAG: DsbE family thiol:disulfide interchange protein [Acetobacteraceae bacterium]
MRRILYLLPAAVFLVLALYFALALRPGHDPHILPSALIDKEAPAFDLQGLAGTAPLTRDGLLGKPVVINFFASWCAPCRIEHPLLMRLAKQENVPVYGIAYKDKPEDTARFLAQFGDPYRAVGLDLNGRTGLDFGAYGVPETYVLDAQGHIRKRFVGPLSIQAVEQELLPLLRQLAKS